MNASLVLVKADGGQMDVPLRAGRALVGRETDSQIRIPASGVSRRHCEFEIRGGEVIVRDLGSRNGTYVNGEKITERALRAGDGIAIDEFVFVLRIDGKPAEIDPSARSKALPAEDDADDSDFGLTSVKRPAAPIPDSADSSVGGFDFDELLDDENDMPKL